MHSGFDSCVFLLGLVALDLWFGSMCLVFSFSLLPASSDWSHLVLMLLSSPLQYFSCLVLLFLAILTPSEFEPLFLTMSFLGHVSTSWVFLLRFLQDCQECISIMTTNACDFFPIFFFHLTNPEGNRMKPGRIKMATHSYFLLICHIESSWIFYNLVSKCEKMWKYSKGKNIFAM